MRPSEAIKSGIMGMFSLSGRTSRAEFWWYVLFVFLCFVALLVLLFALVRGSIADPLSDWLVLAVVLLTIAITIRRLQDRSLSRRLASFLVVTPLVLSIGSIIIFGTAATERLNTAIHNSLRSLIDGQNDISQFGFIAVYSTIVVAQMALSLITFILCLLPSKPGMNQHGPNPHEVPS